MPPRGPRSSVSWKALRPEQRRAAFLKHARQNPQPHRGRRAKRRRRQKRTCLDGSGIVILWWCFVVLAPALSLPWGLSPLHDGPCRPYPLLTFTQAFLFLRIIKTQRLSVSHRFWRALGIALLPHLAARAIDLIADALPRKVLLHPLAWAEQPSKALWLENAPHLLASRPLPPPAGRPPRSHPPMPRPLESFFKAEKHPPPAITIPPLPCKPPAIAWCPCCHAPFLKADLLCQGLRRASS
jgi:hypothetical protein